MNTKVATILGRIVILACPLTPRPSGRSEQLCQHRQWQLENADQLEFGGAAPINTEAISITNGAYTVSLTDPATASWMAGDSLQVASGPVSRKAFTLMELIAVIAIVLILAALLIPALQRMKERAHSVACLSQLAQIGVGISLYAGDHDGWLPRNGSITPAVTLWIRSIQEYIGLKDVNYLQAQTCGILKCPSCKGPYPGLSYIINYHITGPGLYQKKLLSINNPGTTLLLGDGNGVISASRNNAYEGVSYSFEARHRNRVNVLFCDLHVAPKEYVLMDDLGAW